jgi:hypothetical protein
MKDRGNIERDNVILDSEFIFLPVQLNVLNVTQFLRDLKLPSLQRSAQ